MDTLYHKHMTPTTSLETIQAEQFDECLPELSKEAQEFLLWAVDKIRNELANGAGERSAKALLIAMAKDGSYKRKTAEL